MAKVETAGSLQKVLRLKDSVAIIVGIVIGVGIFRVPAEVARYLPSPEWMLFAWILGGVFSLIGAACYAELATSFPKTGGDYVYLRESFGPLVSFLYAWISVLVIRTGAIASVAFVFSEYCASFLGLVSVWVKPIAVIMILFLSFINIWGLRQGKTLQNILSAGKILTLVAIVGVGFILGKGNAAHFKPIPLPQGSNIFSLLALALVPILWTFGGWQENTFVTGETHNVKRVIPLALLGGASLITILYVGMNIVYLYLFPVGQIAQMELIGSRVMEVLCGSAGTKVVECLVLLSAFGAINGMILTSGRITYASSMDHPLFRFFNKVHGRFHTPHRAIIVNALISAILITWGSFNTLLFFTGIIVWFFFGMVMAGIFILRKKFPNLERPYKVWGYPFTPAIFLLLCAALVINTAIYFPKQSFFGFAILLSGIPVYFLSRKSL
ncbi:MAG: amino acid permease [Candidatus Omnitrophica bacterium]|nr:amino acid permease [Candidatus Omnitrophota bacterium]